MNKKKAKAIINAFKKLMPPSNEFKYVAQSEEEVEALIRLFESLSNQDLWRKLGFNGLTLENYDPKSVKLILGYLK
jgi:hypothetical protein